MKPLSFLLGVRADKKTIIYGGIFTTLAILSYLFDVVEVVLYKSMNVFIEGYSPIRIYIVLGWIVFLFLFCSVSWRIDFKKFNSHLMLCLMILVFIVGLFTQIWFNQKFDIKSQDLALVVSDGEMTGTAIAHNHLSKSFFSPVTSLVAPSFESLDPGAGADTFIPILPRILFIFSFIAFLISIPPLLVNHLKNIERGRNMFIAGFGLLTSLIIIRTVDGGILSAHTLLFMGLLYAVLNTRSAKFFLSVSLCALMVQLSWYLIFSHFIASTIDDIYPYLLTACIAWSVVTILTGTLYISNHKAKVFPLYIVGSLCILLVLAYVFSLMHAEIRTGTAYIATYRTTDDPAYVRLGNINTLVVYKYSGALKKVSELIRDQHTLSRFNPVSVPGKTCNASDVAHVSTFRLLSVEPVSDMQKSEIGLSLVFKLVESPFAGMFAYRAVLISSSCLPRYLSVLQEAVSAAGAKHFIISERK